MRIGNHEVIFEEPDVLLFRVSGDVTEREAIQFCDELVSLTRAARRVFFLVDVTRGGTIDSSARRRLAEGMRPVPNRGSVFVGADFRTRVLLQMVIHAIRLLTGRSNPAGFVETEAEARAWVDARRRQLVGG